MTFIDNSGKTNWKYLGIVVILAFVAGGGVLLYQDSLFPTKERGVQSNTMPHVSSQKIGIFSEYSSLSHKGILWTFDFSSGRKEKLTEIDDGPLGAQFYKNKLLYTTQDSSPDCPPRYPLPSKCVQLVFVDLSDVGNPISIASNVMFYSLSSDADEVVYVPYPGEKLNLYRYNVRLKEQKQVLQDWDKDWSPGGYIELLGLSADKSSILFIGNNKLYELRNGTVGLIYAPKLLDTQYELSQDGSKILIQGQTDTEEVGILELSNRKYQPLNLSSLPPVFHRTVYFTNDGKGIYELAGYAQGKDEFYWVFDLETQTAKELFRTDKGSIIPESFDGEHFLIRKIEGFSDNSEKGKVSFFIESSTLDQKEFIIENEETDNRGKIPDVYFIGWLED